MSNFSMLEEIIENMIREGCSIALYPCIMDDKVSKGVEVLVTLGNNTTVFKGVVLTEGNPILAAMMNAFMQIEINTTRNEDEIEMPLDG